MRTHLMMNFVDSITFKRVISPSKLFFSSGLWAHGAKWSKRSMNQQYGSWIISHRPMSDVLHVWWWRVDEQQGCQTYCHHPFSQRLRCTRYFTLKCIAHTHMILNPVELDKVHSVQFYFETKAFRVYWVEGTRCQMIELIKEPTIWFMSNVKHKTREWPKTVSHICCTHLLFHVIMHKVSTRECRPYYVARDTSLLLHKDA